LHVLPIARPQGRARAAPMIWPGDRGAARPRLFVRDGLGPARGPRCASTLQP
jgi:hypothetical protein